MHATEVFFICRLRVFTGPRWRPSYLYSPDCYSREQRSPRRLPSAASHDNKLPIRRIGRWRWKCKQTVKRSESALYQVNSHQEVTKAYYLITPCPPCFFSSSLPTKKKNIGKRLFKNIWPPQAEIQQRRKKKRIFNCVPSRTGPHPRWLSGSLVSLKPLGVGIYFLFLAGRHWVESAAANWQRFAFGLTSTAADSRQIKLLFISIRISEEFSCLCLSHPQSSYPSDRRGKMTGPKNLWGKVCLHKGETMKRNVSFERSHLRLLFLGYESLEASL